MVADDWRFRVMLICLLGASFGPVPPAWSTWVARKVPEHSETGGGLFVAAVQSSAALGAFAGGLAFDSRGSTAVFLLCCFSWGLSALLVYRKIVPMNPPAPASEVVGGRQEAFSCE